MSAQGAAWRTFICRACGVLYDEEAGDPDSGLAPGTRFEDIPDDWMCPVCGVTKTDFELYVAPQARAANAPNAATVAAGRRERGIVIVGAGHAGWQMAQALRADDDGVPITMVTACDGDRYDKPLLSVALAKRLALPSLVKESGWQAAQRLGIRLLARTQAVGVAREASALRTTRGMVRYRHLILAHGAEQRMLPQLPDALCWRLNDLRSYTAFRTRLADAQSPQRIVIAGAGLVGCELANDLALAGHAVTVLEKQPQPLPGLIDAAAAAALLEAWRDLPLQFVGGVGIDSVLDEDGRRLVRTQDGRIFAAEHVVAATGLATPGRLARSAGLHWNNGIAVDPQSLRTSVPNIHALGDCISVDGMPCRFIEPIARQARIIAAHIAGRDAEPYAGRRPVVRVKTTSLPLTV